MKLFTASALAALMILAFGAPSAPTALAAWQAAPPTANEPQPPNRSAESPFALPATPQKAEPKETGQGGAASPFALPSGQAAPAPPANGQASPFALPSGGQSQAAGDAAQEKMDQGLALAGEGKLKEAEQAFAQATRLAPNNGRAWNNLGLARRKLGLLDGALQAYQTAVQADPALPMTYKNLGVLWEQKGDKGQAARNYQRYVELAPDAPDAKEVGKRAAWLMSSKGGR